MKVFMISTTALPISPKYGGVEKLVYDYAEELVREGHEVMVAAPHRSQVPRGATLFSTVRLPEQQDWDSGAYYAYSSLLDDFDVIHDMSHNLYVGRTEPERPAINTIWDPISQRYDRPSRNILCLTRWQATRFAKLYNQAAKYEDVICVNTERYRPVSNPRAERWLFVGKMSPDKSVLGAIELCQELGEPIDIVGGIMPTDNPEYMHAVMERHDPPNVVYYGNVTDEVKIRLMQHAKGIIHFANEAHWLGGAEALACGCPIVTMETAAMREVFDDSIGFFAHWKGDMLSAMQRVGNIDRKACRAFAVRRFSRKKVVASMVKTLYDPVSKGERW